MSTAMNVSPATQQAIESCKKNLAQIRHRFETTLSFVPDDKLNYKPSETAKSPIQIAAHVALSNYTFANIIRQKPPQPADMGAVMEELARKEAAITTKEQAVQALGESIEDVHSALDALTDETIGVEVPTPFFTAPMIFWMYLPARHIDNHASQIDYIQTIWGDMEWHLR